MMPGAMSRRSVLALTLAVAAAGGVSACGEQKYDVKQPDAQVSLPGANASVDRGAKLFVERCSGCHSLDIVGAEGGATKIRDRERTDGPNFNVRKEDRASVLYAIRNGGFSGAIMPENIVVGSEAEDVANFLSKYAGTGGKNEAAQTGESGGGGQSQTE
jgi:mono/diheme cytochrome c family protein